MPTSIIGERNDIDRAVEQLFKAGNLQQREQALRALLVENLDFAPDRGAIPLGAIDGNGVASAQIIAKRDGVTVVYVTALGDIISTASAVRKFYQASKETLIDPILVRGTRDGRHWQFVYPRRQGDKEVLHKLSVQCGQPRRAFVQRLAEFSAHAQTMGIRQALEDLYNVETVTKAFFKDYKRVFHEEVMPRIRGFDHAEDRRLFCQILFNRLMFLYFLQRKGCLTFGGSEDYLSRLWHDYDGAAVGAGGTFYRTRLRQLFFVALSNDRATDLATSYLEPLIGRVPFLNGGLFAEDDLDQHPGVDVEDTAIKSIIIGLFERYNFTITESTPYEVEVAVDPEMLGKVFEELVTGRHESGSYYTPRPIVSFMGKEALKGYFTHNVPGETTEQIARFVDDHDAAGLQHPKAMYRALERIRVCDPACGSGAYLLAMLQELLALRTCLFMARNVGPRQVYDRKPAIVQENLYGVDIDPIAVNIARLRLWLSLIVDFEGAGPPPLPNLDFKIRIGDSLSAPSPVGIGQGAARDQLIPLFCEAKARYGVACGVEKDQERRQVEELRTRPVQWTRPGRSTVSGFDWAAEFAEVFAAGGFDIVIMNPPYLSANRVPGDQRAQFMAYGENLRGAYGFYADLYIFFLHRGFSLLKDGGILAAITPNTFMTNSSMQSTRHYLLDKRLLYLIPLSAAVFTATVYSAILVAQKSPPLANDELISFINLRSGSINSVTEAKEIARLRMTIPRTEYVEAFGHLFFEPTAVNRRLFGEILVASTPAKPRGRRYLPLEDIAPAQDTGIDTGNVRSKLFFRTSPAGAMLPRLLQGTQILRYWHWWDNPSSRFFFVDVHYQPNPKRKGIGRGGRPSGKGEYWRFRGPIENHHVPERLLLRQTEDEPFVGYIKQNGTPIYTDNTVHTLLLTAEARALHISYSYLLGILNSAIMRGLYRAMTQEEGKRLAQVKIAIVNRLPIPIPSLEELRGMEALVGAIQAIYAAGTLPLSTKTLADLAAIQVLIDHQAAQLFGLT